MILKEKKKHNELNLPFVILPDVIMHHCCKSMRLSGKYVNFADFVLFTKSCDFKLKIFFLLSNIFESLPLISYSEKFS